MKKYEFETDLKRTPQVDMKGVWVSLAIGALAFLAAMLLPESGQAQSGLFYAGTDSIDVFRPEPIKDTILITALCNNYTTSKIKERQVPIADGSGFFVEDVFSIERVEVPHTIRGLAILEIRMERTFEKKYVWEFQTKDGFSGYDIAVQRNIIVDTRYLDPKEGCYKLLPLEEK
jgi:hypothetical protein